tara:strand:- start:3488 stop:5953 length:2466 start_codon:yes stop_codon:yes gene_type:complete
MAIETVTEPTPLIPELEGIEVDVVEPFIETTEDGGVLIDFTGGDPFEEEIAFGDNLAEHCDRECLRHLASEVRSLCDSDRNSRKDWEETYIKGLDQLGLKIEDRTTPWPGACGVSHPVLTEAVVRFQAQTITEIFPNSGPVKTKVIGRLSEDVEKQAARVRDYMNYMITEEIPEYRSETEKMLFNLPLAGSAFRKVYWDPSLGRPCSMFVPAEDLVVSYGAPSLEMADRVTHILKKSPNDIRKLQVSGFYRDIDLRPDSPEHGTIQEKYDELTGDRPSYDTDSRHTLYEMHMDLDLTGFEDADESGEPTGVAIPYVVTVDKGSGEVLSIRRNWLEGDELQRKREHFVHYEYLPGLGFYGFGLIHLIGGIAKSATSLLRQLVDAGTLSNLPGGLKARGLRIKGDDSPIMPGEFRDVDVPGGAIGDNIQFLPYKEPSNVLHQLLQNIVEEGRRFASITDMKISDMNQQAPVGTTLAIIERSMKVMNSIQARIHYAMKREFRILSGIVRDFMPEDYEWEMNGDPVKAEDFDDRIDVIPVSDPNSSTMAQRIMQYQAALQLASTAPQIYNLSQLHRQMLDVLGIEDADEIVPVAEDVDRLDPVSENMNILKTDPVKAFMEQDHEAHLQSHMAAAQDPKMMEIVQKSPKAKQIEADLSAHIVEHLGFKYRREIEKEMGVALPPPGEPLPEDIEVRLSGLVAEAADRLLKRDVAEVQLKKQMEQMEDPLLQMQKRELDIKESQVQSRMQTDAARIAADLKKAKMREETAQSRIDSDQFIHGFDKSVEVQLDREARGDKQKERDSKELVEGLKIGQRASEANRKASEE